METQLEKVRRLRAARRAIEISKRFARLLQSQGKPHDDSFTTGLQHIRIERIVAVD